MRKSRVSDTVGGAVALLQDALQRPPAPPVDLHEGAHCHWHTVVQDRPASDWADTELFIVARIASTMASIVELQEVLDREGTIITTRTGPKVHPAVTVLDLTTKRLLALRRALGMGVDNSRDSRARSEAYRRSRVIAGQLADEPLLAQ